MTNVPTWSNEGQSGSILSFDDFNALYCALTGHNGACRWQHRLFTEFEAGRFPTDIELATGLGKTSIIALWILALGRALARESTASTAVPRRLAYVVDRRVVVDQASEFAEQVRERLEQAAQDDKHALHAIAIGLKNAGCGYALAGRPDAPRDHRRHGRHDRLSPALQCVRPRRPLGPFP